ncbi:MAG TPA: pitrilysin family protein [Thermoanaerobaculia bacterium]|nr:pitrilysin family protein [Thermoanaerobaculia bacterium]
MSRFRLSALILLALVATTGASQTKTRPVQKAPKPAASNDVLPFGAVEKTLANGLKVIVVPTGFPNIVSLQIPVQTGSRNEVEAGKSGFAHFFEHMMFRGTKAYPADKYQEILTQVGARQNAFTTDDFTNYYTTFSKEDLETMLKVEADRFQHLDYSVEGFKTESRAILGEYNKNSANPLAKMEEVQRDSAFTTHTYKHTTMGFIKDVEDMPNQFDYSKTFFQRWYRPAYTTIIVAGDVNPPEVVRLVEKYWGGWQGGKNDVVIPQEPPSHGPVYAHVPWTSPTLPFVWVAFHGPGFSEKEPDFAAVHMLFDLYFGPTSDLYKRLVQQEQIVDQLGAFKPTNVDPELPTISARVKKLDDVVAVRDAILKTMALAKAAPVAADRLREAKSNVRYSFARTLDNTDTIAAVLARYVRIRRSYSTLNEFYARLASLTPEDLQNAARKYFTDDRLVVTTLSKDPMPAAIASIPKLETFAAASTPADGADFPVVLQKSALPQLMIKLQVQAGSARDPKGKEGLAALAASMVTDAGSKAMRIDEIRKAFFPIAGAFGAQTDKETTTFTMRIHRDNWKPFLDIVLPMLLDPGMRGEDFQRVRDAQRNALKQDLRSDNEEELAKEALQDEIFAGTPYGHPVLGTVAGIDAIGPDDVRGFWKSYYTRGNVTIGINGAAPDALVARLRSELASLPSGGSPAPTAIAGKKPSGLEIEIIEKDTRATAISFGHPIEVTRAHPDFAALSIARAWLGEHRSSTSHLYQRIREARGMNYGDYAYIEAFPGGMFAMLPNPNVARRAQIFEIWIRPVVPANTHMAIRVALHELQKLIEGGMSAEDFRKTREYLRKNVFLMTATQNQQLGYALDQKFYGQGDFAATMREKLAALKLEDVNAAIRKHLSFQNLSFVIVTKDAKGLRDQLLADGVSTIHYDADKPQALLDEDKVIGARKLGLKAESVRIVPVDEVFAK